MNFSEINSEKITIDYNEKFYNIFYDKQKLIFNTDIVYIPFGLEKSYNNYYIKVLKNEESKLLFDRISLLEQQFNRFLLESNSNKQINFISQIKTKIHYGDFLQLKIPYKNNQFILDVFDQENNRKTIFDLKKKQQVKLKLMFDSIWPFNDCFSAVIKVKSIILV